MKKIKPLVADIGIHKDSLPGWMKGVKDKDILAFTVIKLKHGFVLNKILHVKYGSRLHPTTNKGCHAL